MSDDADAENVVIKLTKLLKDAYLKIVGLVRRHKIIVFKFVVIVHPFVYLIICIIYIIISVSQLYNIVFNIDINSY